ncbi:UNVERIFIED_CONTAM: hypothetical protein Cloal_3590 [Acetivibrio alkalicellulosi]
MKEIITDYIFSGKTKEIYALVSVCRNPENQFEYSGEIIDNNFPPELLRLIKEYHHAIDEMLFSIVENIEDKIYYYELKLKERNTPTHCLYIDNLKISFFTHYPTAKGYLCNRPKKLITDLKIHKKTPTMIMAGSI